MLGLQVARKVVEQNHLYSRIGLEGGTGLTIDQHVDHGWSIVGECPLERRSQLRELLDMLATTAEAFAHFVLAQEPEFGVDAAP